jgi:hypothetical protein
MSSTFLSRTILAFTDLTRTFPSVVHTGNLSNDLQALSKRILLNIVRSSLTKNSVLLPLFDKK